MHKHFIKNNLSLVWRHDVICRRQHFLKVTCPIFSPFREIYVISCLLRNFLSFYVEEINFEVILIRN